MDVGRRGPKPEPAAVKAKKGSSRRPIGTDPGEPEAQDKRVQAPEWLKADGLAVWKRLAPRLAGMNLLGTIDGETFARYCRNFARWLKMQDVLDAEGETYESESPHGKYKRANPAYLIADRLERQLLAAEANFGLNPAERQRIFAARAAAAGAMPDLFGNAPGNQASSARSRSEKAAPAAAQDGEQPRKSAVGFLQ